MKKSDAEVAIRQLVHEWRGAKGVPTMADDHPDFGAFVTWLRNQGYGRYLDFRSTMGPQEDAERWFDQELKQMWRR